MNKKFSIIIHPVNRALLYEYEPGMRQKPIEVSKKLLEWMSPFKVSNIEGIHSPGKTDVDGELVMCPLLMEQMLNLDPRKVFNKVKKAALFAEKRGSSLISLAAYTAMVGNRGQKVAEAVSVPVTTGSHMSLASIPEALLKAMRILSYNVEKMNVLIFGTNIITLSVMDAISRSAKKTWVYSTNKVKTEALFKNVPSFMKKRILPIFNYRSILKDADIIVFATNKIPLDFDTDQVKKGAIIFDCSYPRKIASTRKDILIIDGVTMRPPGNPKFKFNFGLPEGLCFPCMAEPITLALENKWESFSLGKDIKLKDAKDIFRRALKQGFTIDKLTAHDTVIEDEEIDEVRESIKSNNSKSFLSNIYKIVKKR